MSFVGSTPIARYIHERGTRERQAGPGPRRGQEPRHRAARRRHRLRRRPPRRGGVRLGRRAVHGHLGGGRGRRGGRPRSSTRSSEQARAVKVGSGRDAASEMGPVVTREAQRPDRRPDRHRREAGRHARRRRPRARRRRASRTASSSGRRSSTRSPPRWTSTARRSSARCCRSCASDDVDEAIALINANPYGNGTAIFTIVRRGGAPVPARRATSG